MIFSNVTKKFMAPAEIYKYLLLKLQIETIRLDLH